MRLSSPREKEVWEVRVVKLVANMDAVTLRQSVQLHANVPTSPGFVRGYMEVSAKRERAGKFTTQRCWSDVY